MSRHQVFSDGAPSVRRNRGLRAGLLAVALSASLFAFGTASPAGAAPSPESPAKLIYAGWFGNTIPTPSFIAANKTFLETQPFDGLIVYLRNPNLSVNLTHGVMNPTAISYDTMMSVLSPMASQTFTNLTENLGLIMGSTPPDFFDDWSVVVQNFANMARAAKDSGLKGLCFDNEQYFSPWGDYGSHSKYAATKSLAEYEVQARLRGKQVMEAMVAQFPGLVFLTLHGPYVSEPDAPGSLQFPDWSSGNELLGPFFAGNMEGVGTSAACCMDGGELYTLRSETEFQNSRSWRRNSLPSDSVNCSFIPASLRTVWPGRSSISYGVYDVSFGGAAMSPTILRSTLANAMRQGDRYVWFYSEAASYLLPSTSGGAAATWVAAIQQARSDVAVTSSPPPSGTAAAPTNLSATAVTTSSVTLGWTDNASNENGFSIERLAGSSWTQVSTVAANVTAFSDSGLASGAPYSYRVLAFNGSGNSAYTNTATATTSSPAPTPAAPTNLSATAVTTTSVALGWTDNSSNENGFSIERLINGTWTQVGATPDGNVTTHTESGLADNTSYSYRVLAFNGAGNSAYTNTVTATTVSLTPPPAAPTNLSATAVTTASVNLGWTDNSSDETGFSIEQLISGTWTQVSTVASNLTAFSQTGLASNASYSYRVLAFNANGSSTPTSAISVTTSQVLPTPAAPSNLAATSVTAASVTLGWTDNSSNENGFSIERLISGTWIQVGATPDGNITTFTQSGLSAGTSYSYRVLAFNGFGNSETTSAVTVTTLSVSGPPAAPSGLSATAVANTEVDLAWTDNSGNESGFRIYRRRGADGSWNLIGTVAAGQTTYRDTGRSRGVTYQYRVRAFNASGNSAYSGVTQVTMP